MNSIDDVRVFNAIKDQMHDSCDKHVAHLEDQIRAYNRLLDASKVELAQETEAYLNSGIAFITQSMVSNFTTFGRGNPKDYFAALAKANDRPIAYAEELRIAEWHRNLGKHISRDYVCLSFAANTDMKSMAASLNLLGATGSIYTDGPVITLHTPRKWVFNFMDADGRKMFNDYRAACVTNPIMRIVLNLGNRWR